MGRTKKKTPGQLDLIPLDHTPIGENAGKPLSWQHRINIGKALTGKPGSGANRKGRRNKNAKGFCLRAPDGKKYTGKNLRQFAERKGLNYDSLRAVVDGRLHSYSQWTKWKGGKPKRMFSLVSPPPECTKYEVSNLTSFADDRGLDASCLSRVCAGKLSNHKGWTRFVPEPVKETRRAFKLLSPDNIWHEGTNLRAFAREHGLDSTGLTKVLEGRQTHHQGWRKDDVPWIPRKSICAYALIDPTGVLYIGENLKELCQRFQLSHSSMWAVNAGTQSEHNGWKKAPCTSQHTDAP